MDQVVSGRTVNAEVPSSTVAPRLPAPDGFHVIVGGP